MDISEAKLRLDLLMVVEQDLGPGKKSGKSVMFRCPFPGHKFGDRHPSLSVTPDNGLWHCFTCGQAGDVITWLREHRRMSWKEVSRFAEQGISFSTNLKIEPHPISEPKGPPSKAWQESALAFEIYCEAQLWGKPGLQHKVFRDPRSGELLSPLEYLREVRGLSDDTIRRYRIGYCPTKSFHPSSNWGLASDNESPFIYLPQGITIPCFVGDELWSINIRRPGGHPKYLKVRGSKTALFGTSNRQNVEVALFCEGEFDCILADQLVGDLVGVVTLGGNTAQLDIATWGHYLLPMRAILAAYDVDGKSENGLNALLSKSAQIYRVHIPILKAESKDITDYVLSGGDLRSWLVYHLNRLMLPVRSDETIPFDNFLTGEPKLRSINLNDGLDQPWKIDITRPCFACGSMNWRQYPNGDGAYCGTCHP